MATEQVKSLAVAGASAALPVLEATVEATSPAVLGMGAAAAGGVVLVSVGAYKIYDLTKKNDQLQRQLDKEQNKDLVGHFKILNQRIGKGSKGDVLHAYDKSTMKNVAAKQFAKDPRKPELRDIFMEEVNIISRSHNHENIVEYFGHGESEESFWLFMTYCICENLDKFCFDYGADFYQQLNIMDQATKGIEHLHGLDPPVAHRDIKVENILLTMEGNRPVVKLCDFGTSKITNRDADTGLTATMHSAQCGTKLYLAPEFFDYHELLEEISYDKSVDIFALALVFLALLKAKKGQCLIIPSVKNDRHEFPIGQVLWSSHKYDRPSQLPPFEEAEGDSQQVIVVKKMALQMINYHPQERPSASAVLEEIHHIAGMDDRDVNSLLGGIKTPISLSQQCA